MDFMDLLSIFLPALAFICVLFILVINLFFKIRSNKFVNVNCWFCNQWTKVSYASQNSWDCPFCEQYNGFTKDGDYNKMIPEQHDELMNKVFPVSPLKSSTIADNGLCSSCNNNHQLKVQQLAMFSPIDENNFVEEVECYERQLERAYRLCPQCELTVKRTLHKQKSILLGLKLSSLRKQGLNVLNLNTSSSGISKTAKRILFLSAIRYTTVALAFIHTFGILKTFDLSHNNITNSLPGTFVPYAILCKDIMLLIYNCLSSLYETIQYFQEIILGNCISLIQYYLHFECTELYIPKILLFNIIEYNRSLILLLVGLFLQSVFLLFLRKLTEFIKCTMWLLLLIEYLLRSNLFPKLVEVAMCCFLIFVSSSIHKNAKVKKSSFKKYKKITDVNQCFDEDIDFDKNEKLLNSTFNSHYGDKINTSVEFNKTDSPFNMSSTMKLFNVTNKKADDPLHVFGKNPVFENPLNTTYFNFLTSYRSGGSSSESLSSKKSNLNDSISSSYYVDKTKECFSLPLKENSPNKSSEQDWYKALSDLHLSTYPNTNNLNRYELPTAFRVSSPALSQTKPVLSPPKLRNVTQSSWVAGGYWKSSNDFLNNSGSFSNLSRSSSQSSGFGSQTSSQQPNNFDNNVFNSLPPSRTNSVCGEYDRFSVLSEPVYQNNSSTNMYSHSRFYPTLRPDQQIFICPKPSNGTNSQKLLKSPVSDNVLSDSLWNANNGHYVFNSPGQRSCYRESNFAQSAISNSAHSCSLYNHGATINSYPSFNLNNPFYSHTSTFGGKNTHSLSVNSNNSTFTQPYKKGSLLKKWREQN